MPTTEDNGLLQAISDDRHDDNLRLVYADWLEDRGDPRAQYMRLEVELVRKWRYDNQLTDIYEELADLRKQFDPDWVATVRRCTTPAPIVDVESVIPELKGKAKTTVRLHPRPGTAPATASKIGGLFLWPSKETWPECDEHNCPYVPALQLRKQDVPELRFRRGTDLFQVLWCPHDHEPAYCPEPKVYWRKSASVKETLKTHNGSSGRKNVVAEWESYVPKPCILYPERVIEYPDPFEFSPDIEDNDQLERALELVVGNPIEPWSYPEDSEELYQLHLSTADGTKVGGYPDWVQDPAYLLCTCGSTMDCIVYFASWEYDGVTWGRWLPIQDRPSLTANDKSRNAVSEAAGWMFGDAGCMYLHVCRKCKDWPIKLDMQCS